MPNHARVLEAAIFDMDGVVTDTADLHARAWKHLFDDFLKQREGVDFSPFDRRSDYLTYVDGKRREDGIRSFLQSRGIALEEGNPDDDADAATIVGLGRRKNALFLELLDTDGVTVFDSSAAFIRALRREAIRTAIISASRNCAYVLRRGGVDTLFDARVDGIIQQERNLAGKPAPDIFTAAAAELGAQPARSMVVEDALAGVEAGRRGRFGLVVGVARHDNGEQLRSHGADIVVHDLGELTLDSIDAWFERKA